MPKTIFSCPGSLTEKLACHKSPLITPTIPSSPSLSECRERQGREKNNNTVAHWVVRGVETVTKSKEQQKSAVMLNQLLTALSENATQSANS